MRQKKEQRGKRLDPSVNRSIFEKLFQGLRTNRIAEEEGVSHSTVAKIRASLPLFFPIKHGDSSRFDD